MDIKSTFNKPTYNKCLRCNKKLKTEKAKVRGYGDYCWHIHQLEKRRKDMNRLFEFHDPDTVK